MAAEHSGAGASRTGEGQSPSRASAASLIERLRAGEPEAFSEVYAAYRRRIHTFLLRLSRDSQLARDLEQETWLRLAANARRLAPGSDPGAWLFTVARNLYLSKRRWALLDRARLAELGWIRHDDLERTAESPLEVACQREQQRRLERALATLAHADREVLLLIAVEGFAAHEVGAMLALDPATVRKRLSRARSRLQSLMKENRDES